MRIRLGLALAINEMKSSDSALSKRKPSRVGLETLERKVPNRWMNYSRISFSLGYII
jgi:hypothetical protein